MAFSLQCPACRAKLNIEDRLRGRTVKCPKCQSPLSIPEAVTDQEPALPVPNAPRAVAPAKPVPAPTAAAASTATTPFRPQRAKTFLWLAGMGTTLLLLGGLVTWLNSDGGEEQSVEQSAGTNAGQSPVVANAESATTENVGAQSPSATNANVGTPAAASPQGATVPKIVPADTTDWEVFPPAKNPFGIYVSFPAKPGPFNLLEGVAPGISRDFGEAVLESMKPTALRAKVGPQAFSFTMSRLELSGMPVEVYLERVIENLEYMHAGFKRQFVYRSDVELPVAIDVLMKSEQGTRIVRIAHSGEHVMTLFVDGSLAMPYEDPLAQGFLASLRIRDQPVPPMRHVTSEHAIVETPPPTVPLAAGEEPVWPINRLKQQPLATNWQGSKGKNIAFQVQLPGPVDARPELKTLFLPSSQRDSLEELWQQLTVGKYDILYLDQGSRRYMVFATEVPTANLEWYEVGEHGNGALLALEQLFTQPGESRKILETVEVRKGAHRQTSQWRRNRSIIMQRRIIGQYAFLLVLDSDEELAWESEPVQSFFTSLIAPTDALRFD